MHALATPVFAVIGGLTLFGTGVVSAIGWLRRPEPGRLRQIWLKFGLHMGLMALVLLAGALGRPVLLPVTIALATLGWRELLRALSDRYGPVTHPTLLTGFGALAPVGGLFGFRPLLAGLGLATWAALAMPMLLQRRPPALHGLLATALGMALVSMPLGVFLVLCGESYGAFAFLFLMLMANDGLSEGLGRLFGKAPIWPDISPGKTWGGTFGGLVSCLVLGQAMHHLVPAWSTATTLAVSAGISLTGAVGDLLASSIKREAGIKDFGHILPGHGGVLDRFDSLLFTVPLYVGVFRLLGGH
ncbi:MAG: phosphatidate cytidylyltransferase [bacterium]|nr:phosphatidate cytidylyltransferase [bacterium]